jgi:predicted GIY-YIG superfamily endonuclease
MSVYTLELEGGRYYVGYTDDVPRRIAEHFLGRGSHWTRTHPPVKVLEVVPGNKELENATTIALMCKHGWRNVRGGMWCSCGDALYARPASTSPGPEATTRDPRGAQVTRTTTATT